MELFLLVRSFTQYSRKGYKGGISSWARSKFNFINVQNIHLFQHAIVIIIDNTTIQSSIHFFTFQPARPTWLSGPALPCQTFWFRICQVATLKFLYQHYSSAKLYQSIATNPPKHITQQRGSSMKYNQLFYHLKINCLMDIKNTWIWKSGARSKE